MPDGWNGSSPGGSPNIPDKYPEKEKKKKELPKRVDDSANRIIGALTSLANGIRQGGDALVQSLFQAAAQLVPQAAPVLGLVSAVVGLFSGKSKVKTETTIADQKRLIQVEFAREHTLMPSSSLASRAFRDERLYIGLQPQRQTVDVNVIMQGEAGELFAAKVARQLHQQNFSEFGVQGGRV
jgi:hypothetical protein